MYYICSMDEVIVERGDGFSEIQKERPYLFHLFGVLL